MNDFKCELQIKQDKINSYLSNIFEANNIDSIVNAMKYSLMAGGKRIRPVLAVSFCEALGGSDDDIIPMACSIECIHTYSLIHDDLPEMDNDDYRRGKLTNHKVFGQGMAVLAGDGLLNTAYEIMFEAIRAHNYSKQYVDAAYTIAKAAGVSGMVGGQAIDITSEGKKIDENTLHEMHKLKTGALIKAPCIVGTIIAGRYDMLNAVNEYGDNLGIAFQIIDDILDFTGDSKKLGKSVGKDKEENKPTFVTVYGLDKSRKLALEYSSKAIESIKSIDNNEFLLELTKTLLNRQN